MQEETAPARSLRAPPGGAPSGPPSGGPVPGAQEAVDGDQRRLPVTALWSHVLSLHHVPVHVQSESWTQAPQRTQRKVKQQLLKPTMLGHFPAVPSSSTVITLV